MHCPASFRPILSILMVSNVIPGSEGNRGNKVPGSRETIVKIRLPIIPERTFQHAEETQASLQLSNQAGIAHLAFYHSQTLYHSFFVFEDVLRFPSMESIDKCQHTSLDGILCEHILSYT